jgi:hypothetical protein
VFGNRTIDIGSALSAVALTGVKLDFHHFKIAVWTMNINVISSAI